jgi:hypothetical protein
MLHSGKSGRQTQAARRYAAPAEGAVSDKALFRAKVASIKSERERQVLQLLPLAG